MRRFQKIFEAEYENDIVLVFVDNRLQELGKKLKKDCVLKVCHNR